MRIIDIDVINKRLRELETVVSYLESKKGISEKELLGNLELKFAIERAFHLAIQNTIDIGGHILASLGVNDVQTYADIPEKLAGAKVISRELSKNLIGMAKFRNILVHDYIRLEPKKLTSFLKNNLADFRDFSKAVTMFARNMR